MPQIPTHTSHTDRPQRSRHQGTKASHRYGVILGWMLMCYMSSVQAQPKPPDKPTDTSRSNNQANKDKEDKKPDLSRPLIQKSVQEDPFVGLPPMKATGKEVHFRFRPGPKPPGTASERLTIPFPPPPSAKDKSQRPTSQGKPESEVLPLKVLRVKPQGEVGMVHEIVVQWNQPMVPISSLQQLQQIKPPFLLNPTIPGVYRWLGTDTALFKPEKRLPFSTKFIITIPKGIRALSGSTSTEQETHTFTTPRLQIVRSIPSRYERVDAFPMMAIEFNQQVNLTSLQSNTRLRGPSGNILFRVVPPSEWMDKKSRVYQNLHGTLHYWNHERTAVLRAIQPLPLASEFFVTVLKGAHSTEGPLRSDKPLRFRFSTYGPLRVTRSYCPSTVPFAFFLRRCRPSSSIGFYFSNALRHTQKFPWEKLVEVRPKLKKLRISAYGQYLWLSHEGGFPPGRTLTVELKKGIRDQFGQSLGLIQSRTEELSSAGRYTFHFADATPYIDMPQQQFAALEWTGEHVLEVRLRNIFNMRQRLMRVQPQQLARVLQFLQTVGSYKYRTIDPVAEFGLTAAIDQTVRTGAKPNQSKKHSISLAEALAGKPGWILVLLTSQELMNLSRYSSPHRALLVQVTDVGLTARYGPSRIVGLLTHLQTAKPLSQAKATLYSGIPGISPMSILATATSTKHGVVELPGRMKVQTNPPYFLVVEHRNDKSFLLIDAGGSGAVGYLSAYHTWGANHFKQEEPRYFVFTDRTPHRPGETVQLKGIIRWQENHPTGKLVHIPPVQGEIQYRIRSPRWRVVQQGKLKLEAGNTFGLSYQAPEDAELGNYRLEVWFQITKGNQYIYHNFQILAYRAPEYKVEVRTKTPGPFYYEDTVAASIHGRYTFGSAMKGASTSWTFRRFAGTHRPPGQPEGYQFGKPQYGGYGWRYGGYRRGYGHYNHWQHQPSKVLASGNNTLDAQGQLSLKLALTRDKLETPGRFVLEAQVYDQNRQSIANRKTIIAHLSSVYVGVKSQKPLIKAGTRVQIWTIAVDPQGKRQTGVVVTVQAIRSSYEQKAVKTSAGWSMTYHAKEEVVARCTQTSQDKPSNCRLLLPKAGSYTIRATAKDKAGRVNTSETRVYAYGPGYTPSDRPEQIDLIADRKSYLPGQTIRLLINSPFRESYGLLTLERHGIAEHSVVSLQGSTQSIQIPVRREYLPNVIVSLVLVRGRIPASLLGIQDAKGAADLGKPMAAYGSLHIKVGLLEKQLQVQVNPSAREIRPGSPLTLRLRVTDFQNKVTPAALTIALVDEGVLSLLGYTTPDPLTALYPERPAWTVLRSLHTSLLSRQPQKKPLTQKPHYYRHAQRTSVYKLSVNQSAPPPPASARFGGDRDKDSNADVTVTGRLIRTRGVRAEPAMAPGGAGLLGKSKEESKKRGESLRESEDARNSGATVPLHVRSKFATTAYYQGLVTTDRQGEATLQIPMPDNLTTFRIMAVAVDLETPERFGNAESQVIVRKPLLLRPALPRFANYGDSFEASVVINNETGKDGLANVFVRGINIGFAGIQQKNIFVPAGQAREVRFPVKIAQTGTARLQFAATLGGERDAVEHAIPVFLPATAEAFATYGSTTSSVLQEIVPPQEVLSQFGGLDISLSSTALQGLEDAARYLIEYPFECTEQTASRILPIIALKQILPAFKIGTASSPQQMKDLVTRGIARLTRLQRSDGGWGFWSGSRYSWLHLTAYVTLALIRAQQAGYTVDSHVLHQAQVFLESRIRYPYDWEKYDHTSRVMGLWLLARMTKNKASWSVHSDRWLRGMVNAMFGEKKKLPTFARAWLMATLYQLDTKDARVDELLKELKNQATETAGRVHFVEAVSESLQRLMHSNDRSDAIILQTFLDVRPQDPLIHKMVRGLMESRIRGRWSSTQANAYAMLAMDQYFRLYEKQVPNYTVSHWLGQGYLGGVTMQGRSLAIHEQHIPMSFLLKQGRQPLALLKQGTGRLYYRMGLRYAPSSLHLTAASEGFTVQRQYEPVDGDNTVFLEKGRWKFRAGSYVRVHLTIIVPAQRFYAAVIDPLPAGLEAVDLQLKTSAQSQLASKTSRRVYSSRSYYAYSAFEHTEKRDSMVVLFADRLPAGVYEYTYLARATTLGSFTIPPARAEEMYSPETFGRSATSAADVIPALDKANPEEKVPTRGKK